MGRPQKRIIENGMQIKELITDFPEQKGGESGGTFALPNWRGDRTDQPGAIIDVSESATYIAIKEGERRRKLNDNSGPSLSTLATHVASQEPKPHKAPLGGGPGGDDDGGGGGPGGGPDGAASALQGEGGGKERDIQGLLRIARDPDGEDGFFQPQRY